MKIAMIVYSFYETDTRVIRYAESLAERGDQVDVYALGATDYLIHEVIRGVNIYRLQERIYDEKGAVAYLFKILKFLAKSIVIVTKNHFSKRYDLIHVHNVPDFLVFAAIIPKLTGAKVILDIHDIVPEFFAFKFRTDTSNVIFKMLVIAERISAAFSDHIIISNHIWKERIESRSAPEGKCSVILNCPDYSFLLNNAEAPSQTNEEFRMIYPGSLNPQQGVDIAVRAFALIKERVPKAEFHIYGDGSEKSLLQQLAADLGISDRVIFYGWVSAKDAATAMARAHLGIEPKRDGLFSGEALSMKILEFMAVGVPVVASGTKVHKYYFNQSVVRFFKPDDEKELAEGIMQMISDKALREQISKNAFRFAKEYHWENRKGEYLALIDRLIRK